MKKHFPWWFFAGLAMVLVFWTLNWTLTGLRTNWAFGPLWLGYVLVVDGLVYQQRGNSMLTRSVLQFGSLFLLSALLWWMFELLNLRLQNWEYIGREHFSNFQYALLASISFSTVIPAVLETYDLLQTRLRTKNMVLPISVAASSRSAFVLMFTGWIMLALLLIWPDYFFPLAWISVYFIVEPVNYWLGFPNLLQSTHHRNWQPVIALFLAGLICGFFWELWNYLSYPKWVYHVPYVDFCKIFEMPVLGYLGYLPFALEVYAIYNLVFGLMFGKKHQGFLE